MNAVASAVVLFLAMSFGAAAADDKSKLLLTGSTTMAPLMTEIASQFRKSHPGVDIEIQRGGSGRGITDVQEGKADIGMVSRPLLGAEMSLYAFTIARDGVAIVLNKDNPVSALSAQQLRDIFTGRVTNWKDAGGRDAPIAVFAASSAGGSTEMFLEYFKLQHADIKPQFFTDPNPARIRAVAENPNGIVYVSVGEAERNAQAGVSIKLLPIGRTPATGRSIRSGNYPLSRPLALVTKDVPTGLAKEFINFALSSQVTDAIEQFDFIPYLD